MTSPRLFFGRQAWLAATGRQDRLVLRRDPDKERCYFAFLVGFDLVTAHMESAAHQEFLESFPWHSRPDRQTSRFAQRATTGLNPGWTVELLIARIGYRTGAIIDIQKDRIETANGL